MEEKIARLLGMVLALYIGGDILFQICEQLGTPERAVACTIGIVIMAALPFLAQRIMSGPGRWMDAGGWTTLCFLLVCFGIPLALFGMQGTLDGNQAAALVLLPGCAVFFIGMRGTSAR